MAGAAASIRAAIATIAASNIIFLICCSLFLFLVLVLECSRSRTRTLLLPGLHNARRLLVLETVTFSRGSSLPRGSGLTGSSGLVVPHRERARDAGVCSAHEPPPEYEGKGC